MSAVSPVQPRIWTNEKYPRFRDRSFRPVTSGDLHSAQLTSPSESPRWAKVWIAQTMSYSRKTMSFVLWYPWYVVSLTGFGMNRACEKCADGNFWSGDRSREWAGLCRSQESK